MAHRGQAVDRPMLQRMTLYLDSEHTPPTLHPLRAVSMDVQHTPHLLVIKMRLTARGRGMNLGGTEDLVVMTTGDEVAEVEDTATAVADTEVEGTTVVLDMVHKDEEDTDCAIYQHH